MTSTGRRRGRAVGALLAAAALASPAAADGHKDPATATGLALAGTVLPSAGAITALRVHSRPLFALSFAGMVVMPSIGHFYVGEYLPTGALIRLGAGALVGGGLLWNLRACRDVRTEGCLAGIPLVAVGVVVGAVGAAWDIFTVGDAARDHNASLATPRIFSVGASF